MVVARLRLHSGVMTIAAYLTGLRWVDEPVLAAGQLRQGGGSSTSCGLGAAANFRANS